MRTVALLVTLLIIGGVATSVFKSFLQSREGIRQQAFAAQDALLNEFDADPRAVLERIAAAYINCGSTKDDFPGASEIRKIVAKVMMAAITARRQGQSKEDTRARAWLLAQPEILSLKNKTSDSEADNALSYMKSLGERGVMSCVVQRASRARPNHAPFFDSQLRLRTLGVFHQ